MPPDHGDPVHRPVGTVDHDARNPDPDSLWENSCGATRHDCAGLEYYGGHGECGQGDRIWRTFETTGWHPNVHSITLSGKVWTIDSWDGESFTITITTANGQTIYTQVFQGSNFASLGTTVSCGNTGGWDDGYFTILIDAAYNYDQGDLTIEITNSLDQGTNDESIGYGDMKL
jgi:hypothetical protein